MKLVLLLIPVLVSANCPHIVRGARGPPGLRGPPGETITAPTIIPFAMGGSNTIINTPLAPITKTIVTGYGSSSSVDGLPSNWGVSNNSILPPFYWFPSSAGAIRELSAYFTIEAGVNIGGGLLSVNAGIWEESPSGGFNILASVTLLPTLVGSVSAGQVVKGTTTSLNASFTGDQRLVVGFFLTQGGPINGIFGSGGGSYKVS